MKHNFYKLIIKGVLALSCLCGFVFSFFIYERMHCNRIPNRAFEAAKKKLALLSKEDRKALRGFFHDGLSISSYGHTLLEQKPMSILIGSDSDVENNEDPEADNRCYLTHRGYAVWKEHRDWFPENKYKFIEFVSYIGGKTPIIGLIHIKLCKANIAKHLSDFQQVLGESCSSEEVFNILIDPSHEKFDMIINNHFLQGILYGYGRNNAYLFEHNIRSKLTYFNVKRYILNRYIRSEICFLSPSFVCDPTTEETQNLHRLYDYGCKLLYWNYFGRDLLETTLAFFYVSED